MGELYYEFETAPTMEEYLRGQRDSGPPPVTPDSQPNPLSLQIIRQAEGQDWRQQADCKYQYAVMYDHLGETKMMKQERERVAKSICAGCRVIEQCLDEAIANGESGAVWGGLNDEERRKLKKSRTVS